MITAKEYAPLAFLEISSAHLPGLSLSTFLRRENRAERALVVLRGRHRSVAVDPVGGGGGSGYRHLGPVAIVADADKSRLRVPGHEQAVGASDLVVGVAVAVAALLGRQQRRRRVPVAAGGRAVGRRRSPENHRGVGGDDGGAVGGRCAVMMLQYR